MILDQCRKEAILIDSRLFCSWKRAIVRYFMIKRLEFVRTYVPYSLNPEPFATVGLALP